MVFRCSIEICFFYCHTISSLLPFFLFIAMSLPFFWEKFWKPVQNRPTRNNCILTCPVLEVQFTYQLIFSFFFLRAKTFRIKANHVDYFSEFWSAVALINFRDKWFLIHYYLILKKNTQKIILASIKTKAMPNWICWEWRN